MTKRVWLLLGFILVALPLSFHGCGTTYDEPSSSLSSEVLIEPSTLKTWIDAGYVNNSGFNKVVIIEAGFSNTSYNTSHIKGAVYVDRNDITETRLEGLAFVPQMVCSGLKMDQVIKKAGIDGNTTIVFTMGDGTSVLAATRAYSTFRYWGFPKEKLKFLNGYNRAFAAENPSYMTSAVTNVTPSTYSVRRNPGLRPDLRTSLGEMIQAVGNPAAQIVDVRTAGAYNGTTKSTGGIFVSAAPKDYVVFEGHINGAINLDLSTTPQLLDTANFYRFKTASQLETLLTGAPYNLVSSKRTYITCTFGMIGTQLFFVLDAILNWPAELYDGSWSQWGLYDDNAANGGKLLTGSAWKTYTLSTPPTYTTGLTAGETIADFTKVSGYDPSLQTTYFSDVTSPATNQIEVEDAVYMTTPDTGGGGGSGGSGGGSGGGTGC